MVSWKNYLDENNKISNLISEETLTIFRDALLSTRDTGSTLWIAGNGGSAALASHAVADLMKTSTSLGAFPIKSIALHESTSLQTAYANDVSFEDAFADSLSLLAAPGDGLLVFSVSGLSPNLVKLVKVAKSIGVRIFVVVGVRGHTMATEADHSVLIPTNDYQIVENIQLSILHWITKTM